MYGDVVLGLKPESKEEHDPFEVIIDAKKKARGIKADTDLTVDDLKDLVKSFKKAIKDRLKINFPEDPFEQLWGAIGAVFKSWNTDRAIAYRELNNIPGDWGTAVNVQCMVFGNMGETCGTGVAFTRNPSGGENEFYGEYLVNAQGEDVVAGIRTPLPINKKQKTDASVKSLEELWPNIYKELIKITEHPREELPRHAGRRVHHSEQKTLDASDKDRQENRLCGIQDRRRYGKRETHHQRRSPHAG